MARAFGIENTVNVCASEPTSALLDLTKRDGIDGAILTAVSGPILQATVGALRDGGRINLFAEASSATHLPMDLSGFWRRELCLTASYSTTPVELGEAIELLISGAVQVRPLVSHRFDLTRFQDGVRLQHEGLAMKVLFSPVVSERCHDRECS